MTKLHNGLIPKGARTLAYDLAIANKKKYLRHGHNKIAEKFWLTSFMKRNAELSLRSAEATSLGRAMGFNRPVVDFFFFSNLKTFYENISLPLVGFIISTKHH